MAEVIVVSEQADNGRHAVSPELLEKELVKIWRAAAAEDSKTETQGGASEVRPRIRATLSNLVLVVSGEHPEKERKRIDELVTEICITHPSRFFIVQLMPSGHSKKSKMDKQEIFLETSVSSRCVLARSGEHVCSEEIYISTNEDSIAALPNLLLSLFVADVDIIVAALGGGEQESYSRALQKLTSGLGAHLSRFVFDSADSVSFFCGSECMQGERGLKSKLYDLNWHRLERWRGLIAEQFNAASFSDAADSLLVVRLESVCGVAGESSQCSQGEAVSGEALLVAAWLMERMSWREEGVQSLPNASGKVLECKSVKGGVHRIEFQTGEHKSKNSADELLMAVQFSLQVQGKWAHVDIRRAPENKTAEVSVRMASNGKIERDDTIGRVMPFRDMPFSALLHADLVASAPDAELHRILNTALRLSELLNEL